ncbi:putative VWFA domain-containing protein [Gammaproteobacteria bacterium]
MNTIIKMLLGGLALIASLPVDASILVNIVIEGNISITDYDFNKEKEAISSFVNMSNTIARSQLEDHPKKFIVAVNFFGGKDDYRGIEFVNGNNRLEVKSAAVWMARFFHPKYSGNAIYDAIQNGNADLILKERTLPLQYRKVLVVVTNSLDADSTTEAKNYVAKYYTKPSHEIFLYMIGVGSDGKRSINQFKGIADKILAIDNFNALEDAIKAITSLSAD